MFVLNLTERSRFIQYLHIINRQLYNLLQLEIKAKMNHLVYVLLLLSAANSLRIFHQYQQKHDELQKITTQNQRNENLGKHIERGINQQSKRFHNSFHSLIVTQHRQEQDDGSQSYSEQSESYTDQSSYNNQQYSSQYNQSDLQYSINATINTYSVLNFSNSSNSYRSSSVQQQNYYSVNLTDNNTNDFTNIYSDSPILMGKTQVSPLNPYITNTNSNNYNPAGPINNPNYYNAQNRGSSFDWKNVGGQVFSNANLISKGFSAVSGLVKPNQPQAQTSAQSSQPTDSQAQSKILNPSQTPYLNPLDYDLLTANYDLIDVSSIPQLASQDIDLFDPTTLTILGEL